MGRERTESPCERLQALCPAVSHSGRGEGFGVKCNIALLAPWGLDGIAVKGKRDTLRSKEHQAKDTSRPPKERCLLPAVRARRYPRACVISHQTANPMLQPRYNPSGARVSFSQRC